MAWLGFSWGKEGRGHEDGEERQRRMELHEKELFELQRLKEQEELRKKKIIEKSVNSVLDLLERKKEELENKEIVLRELMIIHANEKKELEEEFITKQRHQEDKQREEIENLDEEKERLRTELDQLEVSLEDLMTSGVTTEEIKDNFLPCPECPVCLEMLMPPIRNVIMAKLENLWNYSLILVSYLRTTINVLRSMMPIIIRIMQCSNGHLVCEVCESKPELTSCPTCRQEFTGKKDVHTYH